MAQLAREAHDEVNPQVNAVIEFYDDAEAVAETGVCGGRFHGVPFLRKDLGFAEAETIGRRLFGRGSSSCCRRDCSHRFG
ncbi:hypothetical protein [Sinorhizobium meliloti]|uniref:hypothetical protein n=1 Tax=Rhizobium meliloti TaxID=382 RepID=UPI001F4572DA|nr:hypothetical protein [Sinorhizobium meliloti]